eukprot:TRINITY_DN35576_c0_g1_i1.p1 TRINITY_DN35576_c0_g1~~TRINITY_DN35576_c0_g1_i1.p1  ORF type:complete len:188 (+),score=6.61 TRINITY_DN35576_c0_g1_i1:112-675(+)
MSRTLRPESSTMKSTARSWSSPTFRDWTEDNDTDCTQVADPRYTIGSGSMSGHPKHRDHRMTFLDTVQRNKRWVPAANYKLLRECDNDPSKDEGINDKTYSLGRLRNRSVPMIFSRSVRTANLRNLKKEKPTLLPTSFLTPGPGAYTTYTSFGAPTGPTRKHYFATNKGDTIGVAVRVPEKFHRNSR